MVVFSVSLKKTIIICIGNHLAAVKNALGSWCFNGISFGAHETIHFCNVLLCGFLSVGGGALCGNAL